MPQGNQTGPMGQGLRTGRQMGYCSGHDSPGNTRGFESGHSRGSGRGMGSGRGNRFRFSGKGVFNTMPDNLYTVRTDELAWLRSQADELKRSQEAIDKRISELEKGNVQMELAKTR